MLHKNSIRQKKSKISKGRSKLSHWSEGLYPPSEAMPLEPRIMLDGAAPAVLADVLDANSNDAEYAATESPDFEATPASAHDFSKRNEVVVVDVTVDGYEQLLADLVGEVDQMFWQTGETGLESMVAEQDDRLVTVYAVNAEQDGLQTISNVLGAHNDVDALHVLSHGSEAGVIFNGTLINSNQLESNAEMVSSWGDSLSAEGDILLYGCDVGEEGADVGFVQTLSALTNADIAASSDDTGASSAGGDWDLEINTGSIETDLVTEVQAQAAFAGILSADPTTTVNVPGGGTPATDFLNEGFNFVVTVDNTGTDPGYQPYTNVFVEPGVNVGSASYLGTALSTTEFTWDAASGSWLDAGNNPITDHPASPDIPLPPGPPVDGTSWIFIELPFGSFVPSQPAAEIVFNATLDPSEGAQLGVPIGITAQTGFELGEDPLNNPDADPPILGPLGSTTITPTILEVEKESFNGGDNPVGAESEQGTGPNNPITFELKVDIADGQTVDNILLSDIVPNNVHYLGNLTIAGAGTQVLLGTSDAMIGVHNGNQLSVSFSSVTGTLGENDIIVTYQGYIPELDANGDPILNPVTGGAPDLVENTVNVTGEFETIPVSDSYTDEIRPDSLAIQKSVNILDSSGANAGRDTILPGDLLEWTLKYQVSDYFSLDEFEITDTFSDGHLYVPGSETVEIFENGNSTGPSSIAAGNVSLGVINPATGLTTVTYDMDSVIASEIPGSAGVLDGDLVDGAQSGKTFVHVTFRTEVQETFQFPNLLSGDASIDVGDVLSNSVAITAEVEGTGNVVSDTSSETVLVDTPVSTKSIYAIHGDTDGFSTSDPEIAPGQSVTYRITVELPTSDVEDLSITDYLPLPIFQVTGGYAYTGLYSGVDNVPAPGEYGFGPLTNPADFPAGFFNTTGSALDIATVTVDSAANSVNWSFDPFDQVSSSGGVVDLLFTTSTTNVPFADGLNLTNQALISYDNTNNPQAAVSAIVQIEPLAPELEISKGIVSVDSGSVGTFSPPTVGPVTFNDAGTAGPAFSGSVTSPNLDADPIDSNVSELDAGDIVRFAVVIENTGGFEATDITLNDTFPSELSIPASGLNMTAALGDGTPLTVAGNLFNAAGAPDPTGVSFLQGGSEAFLGNGRVDATTVADGSNIIILTYDLVVDGSATPRDFAENSAELLTFAAFDGGIDYTAGNTNSNWSDIATVETVDPDIQKDLVSSGIIDGTNALNRAVPGEYITYRVVVTVPEGTMPSVQIQDRIDADTIFDQLISITPSSPSLSTNLAGGFAGVVAPASGTAGTFNLGLGTVVNSDTDNATDETIEVVYRVYVRGNANDFALIRNQAFINWDINGNGAPDVSGIWDRAPNLRVITPFLDVQKNIIGTPPTDVGDPITYEIVVDHAANSDTTAYNVDFSDTLPPEIGSISLVSVVDSGGAPVPGFTLAGNTISNPDFDLPLGESVTITVTGTVASATAGDEIVNTADISWTTLDPDNPNDGVDAVEPTLTDTDDVSFIVDPPVLEKTIVSTGINNATNDNTEVVNGEYVTYRLTVTVPEGVTPTAAIIDQLPPTVTYDPTFTPTIAFSSGDIVSANAGVPPTVTGGSNLLFDLGTITNSNLSNPTPETITIEYRAIVSGAAATVFPTNVANFIWDVDGDGNNSGPGDGSIIDFSQLDVIEPILEVSKDVTPAVADAGDTVQYTIEVSHSAASETDAYDATFTDVLPPELGSVTLVSAVDSGGAAVPGFSVAGSTISNSGYDLPLGETITLVVTGVLDTSTSASTTISNTASIDWDTLGDDSQGSQAVEGTGTASNDAEFVVPSPSFSKSLVSTGISDANNASNEVVAGEYVTYSLEVAVPEGTTPLASITDTLDPDLVFDPAYTITAVSTAGVSFTGNATTPAVSGNDVVFNLGTVTNTNVNNAVPDTITITYRVYADNDVVLADNLANDATLAWDSDNDGDVDPGDDTLTDSVSVSVIAPELQVVKTITTLPSDAGDAVVYRYEISHTAASNAEALDASFTDLLPAEIDASSVTAVDGAGAVVPGFVLTPGATQDTVSNPDYDLPVGESIIVTVTGTVNTSASASSTVTNTANIDWDTLGDDAEGEQSEEGTGSDTDSASFVVASPEFEKTLFGSGINGNGNDSTEVVAGEYVAYELVVTVPEGTTPLAQITDTLHFNLLFDPAYPITAVPSSGVTFTGAATAPTVSGSDVIFDLGTITNTNTDNTAPDTITIIYRVYADSDVARGAILNNDATLIWDADNDGDNNDADGVLNDSVDVSVIAPELVVDKSVSVVPSDTGDPLEYTIVIRHSNSGDAPAPVSDTSAFDVTFNDVLPSGIDNPSIVSALDSSGAPVAGFNLTGSTISHTGFDLLHNDFITLTVSGEAGASIAAGDTVDNVAGVNWSTLDDDADDGVDAGESGGSANDNAVFSLGDIEKTILNTGINDASNDNAEVVTGEYVTYQLEVAIPHGTSPLAEITDTLDAGLVFDQVNGVTVTPSSTNLSTTMAPGDFSNVTTSYDSVGNIVSIELGDITNSAPAGTVETLTITYRVYVDNDTVNAGVGDTLNNAVDFKWDIDGDGSNDGPLDGTTEAAAPEVEVIGPELQVTKSLTTVPSDAGDTVTYEILIEHTGASQAAAFDATFSDVLPSEISGVSIVSAVDSSGASVPGFTVSGNTVSHADYDLPLGETITLTVTGTVNVTASASTTVTNTANIDWDTLGDDSQGNQSVEDGGTDSDSDDFVVASPGFEKSIFGTGINGNGNDNIEVVAGEYVAYRLVVTVPEGTTPLAEITDTLHFNLLFDSSYAITATGSAGVSFTGPATTPVVSGSDVTFDLGTITNTNTDDAQPDTITIIYRTYADSDVARGATLTNDATLIWDADNDGDNDDSDGVLNDGTVVTVIAPELVVEKDVSVIPSDSGDPLEYTIVIRHTNVSDAPLPVSGTSAYDVTFNDVLPAGVVSPAIVSAVDSTGAAVPGFTLAGNTVSHSGFDLLHNDFVTLTVSGIADASIVEGDIVDNVANINWSTLDDDADDGFDAGESGGSDSDNAIFSLGNIEKSIVSTGINDASNDNTEVVTGEYVTYQLSVEIPQGVTAVAELEDTLDAGLIFDQANGVTVTPSSTNLSTNTVPGDFSSVATTYDPVTNLISIDLGDITNTAPAGTVETLTVTYRVYTDNDAVNAPVGATLKNAVDFKWDIDGDGSNDGPLDGTTEAAAPEVEVIGPELQVTKSLTTVPSDAGDTVTYEILIEHTGASQAAAFDATFSDVLPSEISGVSIVSAVDSSGASVPGFAVSGNTVSHADYDLPLGETITLTVTGIVNVTASASTTVTNTANIDWDTLGDDSQGNQSVEDGGTDSDSDDFVVASPAFDKLINSTGIDDVTNDNTQIVAGEYVTYDLVVTVPEGTTPLAQITDTLHFNLLFDAAYPVTAVGSSGVTFSGLATMPTVTGSDVVFDLGTITNTNTDDTQPDTVTITYRVYADSDVARGATLNNDATLIWDADNDGDNNDSDGVLSDTTDVSVIAPNMLVEKDISVLPSDVGDIVEYQIVIRHTDVSDAPLNPSDTGAYDIVFNDVLPGGLINPSIISAVDSAASPVSGFALSGNTVSHAGLDIPLGEFITLTVQAEAGPSIVEGDIVDNVANINWSTLDDDADDGFDAGESGGSDSDNAIFSLGNIEKSILNTGINDASNDNTEVVTGEYVTYQLSVEIPQGVTPVAEIEDTLDAGLIFDQSNGITVTPSSTNLSTSTAPGDFSSVATTYDPVTNLISIDLGDITNTAPAGTVETLTVTYRVYTDNDAVNAPVGAILNNAVDFKWDIDGDGSNDGPLDGTTEAAAPEVEVIGPELQVTKSLTTVPSDAGDTVTYEILIEHTGASQAAAFDATFSDVLPSEISGVSIVSAVDSSGASVPGFTVSGNTVSHADYDLPLGETITLTVTGTVNVTASASTTVTNTANIDWDTLGDDSQGNQSVEDGGTDSDSDDFVVASPGFEKSIFGTGINGNGNDNIEVVAGEYVAYRLVVTVPEGTTPLAEITDTLHFNLLFDSSYAITATGSAGVSFTGPATTPVVSGSDVTFDLGTITNTNTDDAQPDTITIIYRTYADSDVARGATLTNDATLIWDADNDGDNDDSDGVLNDGTVVTVIAPELVVEKDVSVIPSDSGDPLEYTIVIRHTNVSDAPLPVSGTSAYDVTFNDVLPAGVVSPAIVSAVDSTGAAVPGFTLAGNTVSHSGFDLLHNDFVTLTVSGIADASIVEGDIVDNVANINWSTLDDDADDGFDAGESGGSDSDNAIFSLGNIEKSIVSTGINDASNDNTEVVTGEYVTYQLSVEIPQGVTAVAELEDTLDAGLIFDQANGVTVTPSSTNLSTSTAPGDFSSVATTYDPVTNLISIDLGDITNTALAGTVETLTVTYRVYTDNDAVNAPVGATLNNAVDFKWDIDGDGSNDGPLDGTTEAAAPEVEVIGPALQVTKSLTTIPSDAGDTVTYEIVIEHTGASQAAAFDATFSDVLPSEISSVSIVSAVDSGGASVPGFIVSGNTVSHADYDLPLGETITLTVTGTVNVTASASTTVTNTANIDWDTLGDDSQGNQSVEDGGTDSASDDFVVASPAFSKSVAGSGIEDSTNGSSVVVAGEYVSYDLVVTVPEGTTPLAQITDTLHSNLVFDPGFAISAVGSAGVSFTGLVGSPVVAGNDVIFDLGTITNTNTDDSVPDTVTITYRVYADSDVASGDTLNNNATLVWDADNDGDNNDNDGALSDTSDVSVIAPQLLVDKEISVIPGDIGDALEYTIVIRHTDASDAPLPASATSAYDVTFSDVIPSGIDNVSVVSAVNSAGIGVPGFGVTGNTVSHSGFDLAHNDFVTLTVSGVAGTSIVEGDTVVNTADINWTTLDDASDDGFDAGESGGSDDDSATFSLSNVEKTVLNTGIDDASNDNTEAVTGEYVTYQIAVEIPHGVTPVAEIEDTLDAGLLFDQAFGVSVVPSSTNLSTTSAPGDFTGVSATYDVAGNIVSIDLGDITNTAPIGMVETLTITYRVFVDNDTANAAVGATLNNAVDFKWDIDGDGSNDGPLDGTTEDAAPEIEVIGPELQITKTLATIPDDAGDTVTYQMLIEHTAISQAAAFDATFTDTLPSEISNVSIVSAISSTGAPVAGFSVVGNTVSHSDYDLPLGESITLTVTGTVNTTASASSTVTNTADIDWQTLGDDSQGNQSVEDGGSATDSENFVVASPEFSKSVFGTGINGFGNDNTEVVAGEYVAYELVVKVPEGTTPLAEITDTLHFNLVFDASYPITATGSSGVTFTGPATLPTVSGSNVSFDLGTITNTNTDDTVDDTVTIIYRVYADSDVARGAVLNNDATLIWDADNDGDNNDGDGQLSDTSDVTVIAPELVVDKQVTLIPSDVDDPIEYTIVIRHSDLSDAPLAASGGSAYDVVFNDAIPAGITGTTIVSAIDSAGNAIPGFTLTGNTVSHAGFDLLLNDTVTLTVSGIASGALQAGDTVTNEADISWSTLDDSADDGFDAGESGGSTDDTAVFSLSDIEKTIVSTGINDASNDNDEVVSGEYVTYQLSVDVPHGVSPVAEIEDTLGAGLIFDQLNGVTVVASSTNVTTSIAPGDFSSVPVSYDTATNIVSFDLGDISNSAPVGTVETLSITYRVFVDNDAINAGPGDLLNNAVDFKWDIDGDGNNDGPLDGTTEAAAPELEVIAPELTVSKQVVSVPSDAGDTVTYEMQIEHTDASKAGAFDATFTDTLPSEISGVSVVSAVDSAGVPVSGFAVSGNTVSNPDFDLPLGESITVTVSGVLNTTASASTTVDNIASISWDTLGDPSQGNESFEDGGTDSDNDTFIVASPTFEKLVVDTGITDASNDNGQVVAGEYITYNLVTTVPEGTTPLVQITDTLDPDLLFDPSFAITAVGSNGVTFTGSATSPVVSGNSVVFDLGTITNTDIDNSVADTVTITYRVYADSDVTQGVVLPNTANLIWDADNNGSNTDADDGALSDNSSVTVIEPQLVVDKSVSQIPSEIGDPVSYTFVVRHSDLSDAPLDVSQTNAFDIVFNDNLPAGLTSLSIDSALRSDGSNVGGFQLTGNTVSHAGFDLPFGEEVTIVVSGIVGPTSVEGDTITNIAEIDWSTLDDNSDDGIDSSESGGSQSDSASFTLSDIEKTITGTGIDDATNDNNEAVVGEYIDYQVVLEVPKGFSPLAEIFDELDPGLVFDSANGVTVTASGTNVSSSDGPGDFSAVTANYDAQANSVSIPLGDISNNAPGSVIETLTVAYRVYVANDAANVAGAELNNRVSFRWDIDGDGSNTGGDDGITQDIAPEVTVVVPELQLQKTVIEVPGETGDSITYEFHISHTANSSATAYDVGFNDVLPSGLSSLVIDSAVDESGNPVAGFTLTGNSLDHTGFDLNPGETVTVTLSGIVNSMVDAGDTIVNTATVNWTSLDSNNPGDGADVLDPTFELQQSTNDSDSFSIADLNKTIISTSIDSTVNSNEQVVVGEYITYQLVVDVPQGTTSIAEIQDTLDQGLSFDSLVSVVANTAEVTTDIGAGDFSDIASPAFGDTGTLSFPLGTLTNTNLDNGTVESITLTYRVFVANESAVQPGVLLGNNATLGWDIDGDGIADNVTTAAAPPVTVLEPVISVSKTADDPLPHLGQVLTYTITVTNESAANGTDARDVTVVDELPPNAVFDPASILINGSPLASDANATDFSTGNTLALALDNVTYGSEVLISYQATLTEDTNNFGASVDNLVTVEWSTLSEADNADGFDSAERNSTDGLETRAGNTITLTAPDYELQKSSSANSALNAGDSITYTLQVTNIGTHEGTGVVVSDQFPVEALGQPVAISGNGSFDPATGTVDWLIPSLAVNESVTLTVDAIVANPQDADIDGSPESADDVFSNGASVTDDGLNGGDPDLSNNSDSVTDQITAAPDYTITKTNDTSMVAPTEQVSYLITASNEGTQTGTNVVITDSYPVEILTIVDSVGGVVDESSGTITWNISSFEVGQTETFNIVAEVLPTANLDTADQLFTNSVSITDDGANGVDPTPANNESSESDMLLAGAGEPLILAAIPESIGAPPVTNIFTSESRDNTDFDIPNTDRILTSETLNGRGDGDQKLRPGEIDLLNGGDLLDEINLAAPEIHCAPGYHTYDYQSDPANLELLDWLQEPTDEEQAPDALDNATELELESAQMHGSEAVIDTAVNGTQELENNSVDAEPVAKTLQQQIAREANNLYGAGKSELLEAFKESA